MKHSASLLAQDALFQNREAAEEAYLQARLLETQRKAVE